VSVVDPSGGGGGGVSVVDPSSGGVTEGSGEEQPNAASAV